MGKGEDFRVQTINPASGEALAKYPIDDESRIERLIRDSASGSHEFRALSLTRRADLLMKLAETLEARKVSLAALITAEMGKTLREARAEVQT